jgi:hypothetical protein
MQETSAATVSHDGTDFACSEADDRPFTRPRRHARSRRREHAMLGAALTAAISVTTIVATLQLSLVAAQTLSTSHVARTTARWLAIRMDTADDDVVAQARSIAANLPGLAGGGLSSVAISPPCAALIAGRCPGRDSGTSVTVTIRADMAAVLFLPTSYSVSPFVLQLPIPMQLVSHTMVVE